MLWYTSNTYILIKPIIRCCSEEGIGIVLIIFLYEFRKE